MPPEVPASGSPEALQIPYSRIATFVRQITHDVRNNLNSMDLQAAYVAELVTDPEAVAEVKRIRSIIQTSAKQLQALSANFQTSAPNLIDYTAAILVEDLRDRVKKAFPETADQIEWDVQMGQQSVEVDVELFFSAIIELFRNAFQFQPEGQKINAFAGIDGSHFMIEIREGKSAAPTTNPESWGKEPFTSSRRSGYGLGLFKVRRTIQTHGGALHFSYDEGCAQLKTRVCLPLVAPS